MQQVMIFGSGGHANVVIDLIEKQGNFEIIGLLDDFRNIGETIAGYQVLGGLKNFIELYESYSHPSIVIAIGDNYSRRQVCEKLIEKSPNIFFPNLIHPSAIIGKDVKISQGVIIMAGAVVQCNSVLWDFSFINTNASVDHDLDLGKFSSIGPGCTLGGNCKIGEGSVISIGATLIEKIVVGNNSIIGASTLLNDNCPDNTIMYGIPGKFIRTREHGEQYLK